MAKKKTVRKNPKTKKTPRARAARLAAERARREERKLARLEKEEAERQDMLASARRVGRRHGFEEGFEAAKLEAFLKMAERGEPFMVMPSCFRFLVPLVARQLDRMTPPNDGCDSEHFKLAT